MRLDDEFEHSKYLGVTRRKFKMPKKWKNTNSSTRKNEATLTV